MMTIQSIVAIAAVGLAALASFGSLYVLFFALVGERTRPGQDGESTTSEPRTRFLVLVPAHNEEKGIRPTLQTLSKLHYPIALYRVIVVADNCDDDTAAVVREEGFECWVRDAPELRGKGQALRWALDRANSLSFDAVVVIDADNTIEPGFLQAFDFELGRGKSVLQAWEEFELNDRNGFCLLTVASKRAENALFWRPRQQLGLALFLQGNGFCLRRDVLDHVPWTAYSIVEDLEFSLQLALHDVRVCLVESARLVTRTTASARDAFPRGLRGASGAFQVTVRYIPSLLRGAWREGRVYLAEAAIALLLTSRVVLVYLTLLALGFSFLGLPVALALGVRLAVAVAIVLQLAYLTCVVGTIAEGRQRWRSLAALPGYMGWLLVVQFLAALGLRRNVWARTTR